MAEREDLNIPMIVTVGAVSVILTIASVFAVQALYFSFAGDEVRRKVIEAPTTDASSRLAEQDAKLTRYSWIDRDQGKASIPIERAMRIVVDEIAADQGQNVDIEQRTARSE